MSYWKWLYKNMFAKNLTIHIHNLTSPFLEWVIGGISIVPFGSLGALFHPIAWFGLLLSFLLMSHGWYREFGDDC